MERLHTCFRHHKPRCLFASLQFHCGVTLLSGSEFNTNRPQKISICCLFRKIIWVANCNITWRKGKVSHSLPWLRGLRLRSGLTWGPWESGTKEICQRPRFDYIRLGNCYLMSEIWCFYWQRKWNVAWVHCENRKYWDQICNIKHALVLSRLGNMMRAGS